MNNELDFDEIGKRTPYLTPEGFFDEMQKKVMERTQKEQRPKRRLWTITSAVAAVAAILAGFLFIPSFTPSETEVTSSTGILAVEKTTSTVDPVDKWINDLSDEELEELVSFSDNDIFLN